MKYELFTSNINTRAGVPQSVMVKEGADVPRAVQCRGVVWTKRVVLDCTRRFRPWAKEVQDCMDIVEREGYATCAFGVVVTVFAPPYPRA